MARRNQNPRKAAMRKMMGEFLKEVSVKLDVSISYTLHRL